MFMCKCTLLSLCNTPASETPNCTARVLCGVQVDEVKNIMSENIEKVLSRGEKLDLLVDKTDNLMFEVGGTG